MFFLYLYLCIFIRFWRNNIHIFLMSFPHFLKHVYLGEKRKLRNFYEKVTDFLLESYRISKTLQFGGVVACGIRGRRILKSADCFLYYFYFLEELLTMFFEYGVFWWLLVA